MALVRTTAPVITPVSLVEAKAHLRIEGSDEDMLVTGLIDAATAHVERGLGLALITQGWMIMRDRWPASWLTELPLAPLQSVASITTYDALAQASVFDASHYFADTVSNPPRLVLHGTAPWPEPGRRANGIEIVVTAGFGDTASDVPEPVRQALLLLIAHWYESREPVVLGDTPHEIPGTIAGVLAPYRPVRL